MSNDGLSAGAAARRLGVAVTTLRTWHQRYGLGPSRHEPGHHRRYTDEDMVRLQVMQRLTAQGVSPAEAAAWARRTPVLDDDVTGHELPTLRPAPHEIVVHTASEHEVPEHRGARHDFRAGETEGPPMEEVLVLPQVLGPAGGGQTIALGLRADPAARGLARAAMRLDAPAMRHILDSAVAGRGVIATWDSVMTPVLIGIGERYEATNRFIEVEHLLSRSITEVLSAVARPPQDVTPKALLAAAEEEQHTLPLEALAAALAEAGLASRLLGARMPSQALIDAVERTGPVVVVLWSQLPSTGEVAQLERLLALTPPPLVVAAAGPGWPIPDLPPAVTTFRGLADAFRVVAAACR